MFVLDLPERLLPVRPGLGDRSFSHRMDPSPRRVVIPSHMAVWSCTGSNMRKFWTDSGFAHKSSQYTNICLQHGIELQTGQLPSVQR